MMKRSEKTNRTRKVTVRFSEGEYDKIMRSFRTTTKQKLSEYIRYVLLEKPVTVYTRDQSMDDILALFISLKNELSAIGNNYNQSVKRLHTMDRIPEIKLWTEMSEKQQELFMNKVTEINFQIAQLSDKWLQE
jgi:hypothetical protein